MFDKVDELLKAGLIQSTETEIIGFAGFLKLDGVKPTFKVCAIFGESVAMRVCGMGDSAIYTLRVCPSFRNSVRCLFRDKIQDMLCGVTETLAL